MMSTIAQRAVVLLAIALSSSLVEGATPAWVCWGPDAPDPCRNTLRAVAPVPGSNAGEAWAAGYGGTILRWNGSSWRKVTSQTEADLLAITMASATLGWAAGFDGALVQWNGSRWFKANSATTDYIRAIEVVPDTEPAEAWAAGDKYGIGQFVKFDGSKWTAKVDGSYHMFSGSIYAISMLSEDEGWAVGTKVGDMGSGVTTIGQILRWDGGGWNDVLDVEEKLRGADFFSSDDGWAVGEEGVTYHWDGGAWTRFDPVTEDNLYDVVVVSPTDVWAAGEYGALVHWDGDQWNAVSSPVSPFDLFSVTANSAGFGWSVGTGGVLVRWDGSQWQVAERPPATRLEAVTMTPGTEGTDLWAAGGSSLQHWDGRRWSTVPGPGRSVYAVSMLSPDDGWGAGSRSFARWDGFQWHEVSAADSSSAIVMLGPDNGWSVGWGTIHHFDGSKWTKAQSPTTKTFQGISAVAADDIWASGYSGTIAHYDGVAWRTVPSPVSKTLQGISMASANLGYIVGWNSGHAIALEWNGAEWLEMDLGESAPNLTGVDVRDPGTGLTGWMVGDRGYTLQLTDGQWREHLSPTTNNLLAVAVVSENEAWAVGANGVFLHWTDTPDEDLSTSHLVAAAARLQGQAGTNWKTDLVATNLGIPTTTVAVEAWLRDQANPNPLRQTVILTTMQSLSAGDVLGGLFGLPSGTAASLLLTSGTPLAIGSRTYNATSSGTFGQSIPAVALNRTFAPGQVAYLVGLVENDAFRSNLGLVGTSDTPIKVEAVFRDADGNELGRTTYDVPAQGSIQLTRVLRSITSGPVELAWAELRSSGGDFAAYLSTVDAATGDPVYQTAVAAPAGPVELFLQGIAKVSGAAGTDWQSSLTLVNTASWTRTVTFSLLVRGQANPSPDTVTVTLAPGEARVIDDALQSLFGVPRGAATLSARVSSGVLIQGRTFNQTSKGTYGQFIPAQDGDSAITGSNRGILVGVSQNDQFRSNLGLTNAAALPAEVQIDLFDANGVPLGSPQTVSLAAGEVVQVDRVAQLFTTAKTEGATLVVQTISGASVQAFLSVIDGRTGDPVFQVPTIDAP